MKLERVELQNVYKQFTEGSIAFGPQGFSMIANSGDVTVLLGPNGCGKTTILKAIAGLVEPTGGEIQLFDASSNRTQIDKLQVSFMDQDHRNVLLPWKTALENLALVWILQGESKRVARLHAKDVLGAFGALAWAQRRAWKLSGGQGQLIALLRSIYAQPALLLLDEPFSALDRQKRVDMYQAIDQLKASGTLTFIVTHDIDEALLLADRIVLMTRDGRIGKILDINYPRPRQVDVLFTDALQEFRKEALKFSFNEE